MGTFAPPQQSMPFAPPKGASVAQELDPGFAMNPQHDRRGRGVVFAVIGAGIIGAVLAGLLVWTISEKGQAEDALVASEQQVSNLSADLAESETSLADAKNALTGAESDLASVEGDLTAAEGREGDYQNCGYHLLKAVNAVNGAFGTENWFVFYNQVDQALPFCERAIEPTTTS
jgi:hypothetical protein